MCTISVIAWRNGLRVACNRDERRDRTPAAGPERRRLGDRQVLMPIDGAAGGSWIAVTDAGLVFALLNVYRDDATEAESWGSGRTSRGCVIPLLARCATADAAIDEARRIDWSSFAPFRLLVVGATRRAEARWTGRRLRVCRSALRPPFMLTSSGLGDAHVQRPRARAFRDIVGRAPRSGGAQDRFHRHRWPDRPHLSVLMSRPDARTVSITVVELTATRAVMRYVDVEDSDLDYLARHGPSGAVQGSAA